MLRMIGALKISQLVRRRDGRGDLRKLDAERKRRTREDQRQESTETKRGKPAAHTEEADKVPASALMGR